MVLTVARTQYSSWLQSALPSRSLEECRTGRVSSGLLTRNAEVDQEDLILLRSSG